VFDVNNNSIKNSEFIKTSNTCKCISGYTASTANTFSTPSKNNQEFVGTCNKGASTNDWVIPLAISGGIVGVSIAGGVSYAVWHKFFKTKAIKGELSWDTQPWSGSELDYLTNKEIQKYEFKGTEHMEEITNDYHLDSYWQDQVASFVVDDSASPFVLGFDPVTQENVLVDKSDRLVARWNRETKLWDYTEGASRWRYSDKLGYKIISTSDKNYLNPNTGRFQNERWESTWKGLPPNEPIHYNNLMNARELEGVGDPLQNLTAPIENAAQVDAQLYYVPESYISPNNFTMKFDLVTKENILVDKQNRLLARWDELNKEWSPAEGAEHWRFSEEFQHDVISRSGSDFLNPKTYRFEEIPGEGDSRIWVNKNFNEYVVATKDHILEGNGRPMENLLDPKSDDPDIDAQQGLSNAYNPTVDSNIHLKYDPVSKSNVLVDNEDRLLARWDTKQSEWTTVDGAERWTWNKKLNYNVIAKNEDANNFLNPNTGKYEVNGEASTANWEEDYEAQQSVSNTENLENLADMIKNNKETIQQSIRDKASIPKDRYGDVWEDFNLAEFDAMSRRMSATVADDPGEFELGELGPDKQGGAGSGICP